MRRLYGSGGMPSSHSSTVTGLACAIGLREGVGGPLFAIAFVLACVVCTPIFDLILCDQQLTLIHTVVEFVFLSEVKLWLSLMEGFTGF